MITGRVRRTPCRASAKPSPGVDPRLLIKDAAKLMPEPTRRLFLRGARQPRRARPADRLRHHRRRWRAERAVRRCRASTTACRRGCSTRTSSRRPIRRARSRGRSRSTPITARTRRRRSTGGLQARGRRPGREQEAVDARRALRAAAGDADHAPHLRRGLERDRQVERRAAVAISSSASAPTRRAKYVWFQCADDYSTSIDMPTALHPQTQLDVQVRRPDPAARSTASR